MADVTPSVADEVDEDDFEEVGFDYLLKSRHSRLQENGNTVLKINCNFQFYQASLLKLRSVALV